VTDLMNIHLKVGKVKGQANPAQAWTCPKGSRKSLLPHFKAIDT